MESIRATTQDDEIVKQVLSRLDEGDSREVIAATMGYQNHKSLDQYLRRRHYTWDAIQGTYVPSRNHPDYREDPERYDDPATRARQVVEYLRHGSMRVKDVARVMRFADHRELSRYMNSQGYIWNTEVNNYSRPRDPLLVPTGAASGGEDQAATPPHGAPTAATGARQAFVPRADVEHYLPLLQMLDENQSRLTAILDGERTRDEQQLPRYTLRGVKSPCSFYMVKGLHTMVKDFADERNVKLTEVVEAALIEFLQRHGYSEQLKCLFGT